MGKKNKKMFLLSALVMLCVIPAFALLKTGVFGNEKNFLASDGNARYDIVADLDGGKFEVSAKPEFVKMDNGKWLHKYKPSAKPVTVPTPVKEGYEFTGWTVGDNQTLQLEYSIPVWNKKNINLKAHWMASESILLSGSEFNRKIAAMLDFVNVTKIKFIKGQPDLGGVDVSEKQNRYIMASISGDTLMVACTGGISANPDCSGMFEGMSNIESITFENFDTSEVTNMSRMFNGCGSDLINPDPANPDSCGLRTINGLDKFNTSKVANIDRMFAGCSNLQILNLSNFDTSKVNNMDRMFAGCNKLSKIVGLENLNIQNVSDSSYMFAECDNLSGEITFTNPNMKIYHMFDSCSTNKGTMFIVKYENGCKTLAQNATIQVGQLNYRHVYLYGEDYMLDDGDTFNQVIKNIPNFDKVKHIKFVKGSPTTGEYVGRRHASCDIYEKNMNPTDPEPPTGTTDPEEPEELPSAFNPNYLQIICSKCAIRGNIKGDILYISAVAEGNIYASNKSGSMSNMFKDMPNIETITFDNFNTSEVYNMSNAFAGCTNLQSLDLSNFNTAKVKNMSGMFENCSNLETINLNNINMVKVTDTSRMFKNCSKLSGEMTIDKNIASYQEMFLGCSSDTNAEFWVKYISPETKNVAKQMVATKREGVDHVYLHEPEAVLLPGTEFNSKVKAMPGFSNVTEIRFVEATPNPDGTDLSEAQDKSITGAINDRILIISCKGNIQANTNCSNMFKAIGNIVTVQFSNFDTSNMNISSSMFMDCTSIINLDLNGFNTFKLHTAYDMFNGCSNLASVKVNKWDTESLTNTNSMFYNCSNLEQLDLGGFKLDKLSNAGAMFMGCSKLCGEITISSPNITSYYKMFEGCSSDVNAKFTVKYTSPEAKEVARHMVNTKRLGIDNVYLYEKETELDCGDFDLKVKNLPGFNNVTEIRFVKQNVHEGVDISYWKNGNASAHIDGNILYISSPNLIITNPDYAGRLFAGFENIKVIDLGNFNIGKETKDVGAMFADCYKLETINGLDKLNTSNIENMQSMFWSCINLKSLDLHNWNVSKVTDMTQIFGNCQKVQTINICGWNVKNVQSMRAMFSHCHELRGIEGLSGLDTSNVTDMQNMFFYCWNLTSNMTIMNPNLTEYSQMYVMCSYKSPAIFTLHYTPDCKGIAEKMLRETEPTLGKANVVLGEEKPMLVKANILSMFKSTFNPLFKQQSKQNLATNQNTLTNSQSTLNTPMISNTTVKLTLINGVSAQYPKQIIEIKNNKIPNLNAPDLNLLYAGQFGGYYYDEQFTKPVKHGDIITRDLTIYARW